MQVGILAVGRLKSGPDSELATRYLDRARKAGRTLGFRGFAVEELPEAAAARAPARLADEEERLFARIPKGGRVVCLDEGGDLLDSAGFAADLRRAADAAVPRITFVIGGPDGLGYGILASADRRVAFGRLTWPHQLMRILLAEQLYRAMTILSGHPYHRA